MRKLVAFLLVLSAMACGSQKKNSALQVEIQDYYFDQQIGGTAEAGINESYYFKFEDDSAIMESMTVGGKSYDLKSKDGMLFQATTELMSNDEVNPASFRKVSLIGKARRGDGMIHIQLDSVPMREQIFMPSALPQGDR